MQMKNPTDKQLALIQKMEEQLDVKFEGTSIQDASQFISQHMEKYQEEQAFVFEMVYNENNY